MLYKKRIFFILAIALFLFSVQQSAAGSEMALRFASVGGSGTACTQASPCSLQTAVSQAATDDTVYVAAGTYIGSGPDTEVVLINTGISLLGGWDGAATGPIVRDPVLHVSIIDGQNARRGITMNTASTVDGFTIRHGAQVTYGAGILVSTGATGTAVISHNIIQDNIAVWYGGGMGVVASSTAVIENNQFFGNQSGNGSMAAYYGGGLFTGSGSTVTVTDNLFQNNQSHYGAAISADNTHMTLARNRFIANNSPTAVDLIASSPVTGIVANNLFQDNVGFGLTVHGAGYAGSHILHNTFVDNGAGGIQTDALQVAYEADVNVLNNIFAGHTGASITTFSDGTVSGSRNLFWQNGSDPHLLVSPIQADPAFLADGYHIGPTSAAINAGVDVGIYNDIDGEGRPQQSGFDVGADESPYGPPEEAQPGPTFTVNVTNDADDGVCGMAHCSLREAMNAANAQPGANSIIFAESAHGTILPVTALPTITEDVNIGGPGPGYLVLNGALVTHNSLLRVNSGHLMLSGLTVWQGGSSNTPVGGALLAQSQVTLSDLRFNENQAQIGGAVALYSDATLNRVEFYGNAALGSNGGALVAYGGTVTMYNSSFSSNTAVQDGGAIYAQNNFLNIFTSDFSGNQAANGGAVYANVRPTMDRATFSFNTASADGGAIYATSAGPALLTNLLLTENSAAGQGNALFLNGNAPAMIHTVNHVTIAAPERQTGTAVQMAATGTLNLSNSIIANHTTGLARSAGTLAEDYNLFHDNETDRNGLSAGANSLAGDPLFVSAANGLYQLTSGSPAVDAGVASDLLWDYNDRPRPQGSAPDMGFDELAQTAVTGPGSYDIGDTGVSINVTQPGNLANVQLVWIPLDHPSYDDNGDPTGQGGYWSIAGLSSSGQTATGFSLTLTLPYDYYDPNPTVCRWDGAAWDCDRHGMNATHVWRHNVTAFSDWAVGEAEGGLMQLVYLPLVVRP